MSRLVLFVQKSMGGVRRGVKAYNKGSITCQSCNANTVHVKIRVVVKLLVMQEIKCAGCQEVACSTSNPSIRAALGQTGPESTESPSFGTRIMSSEIGGNRYRCDYEGPDERPISYTTSINQVGRTLSQSRSKSQSSLSKSPRESYGDRNSTSSNDGSNEYFEDQCSNAGQCSSRSTRSSYGPVRRPSLSHTDYRLDLCGIGAGVSGTSLAFAQRPISLSDTGSIEEKSIKENQRIALADWEKVEGHRTSPVLDNRGSVSSTDLTIGNFEPRRRSDYSTHRHSSLELELEIERHPGPTLAPSSDKSIRSIASDKRPGRRNLTHLHRAAVSRSYIQKIERQDEQEQQHETEKNNAKRRSSLTSDFEGLPTEEDVRRARKIWNNAQKKNSPHHREDHDVQWAKNTLRALANWERLRQNLPPTRSVEQLHHLRSVGSFESSMPTFYPDMDARHHQPFVPQVMSPRLSLLSLQPLPAPVEEEPEDDSQDGEFDKTYSPLYHSSELPANPPARRASKITAPRPGKTPIRQAKAEMMSTSKEELDGRVSKRRLLIGRAIAPKSLLPRYKKVNKRCIKAFKSITEKVLPHPRPPPPSVTFISPSSPPVPGLPLPASVTPTSPPQSVAASTAESQEEHAHVEPRSFGVIHDFMANEEERRRTEGEISASVGLARMPLVEMQVQLRYDIFAR